MSEWKGFLLSAIGMSIASGAPFGAVYPREREPEQTAPPEVTADLLRRAEEKRARKLAKRRERT